MQIYKKLLAASLALVLSLSIAGCGIGATTAPADSTTIVETALQTDDGIVTDISDSTNDLETTDIASVVSASSTWDDATATQIDLNNGDITISGAGATANGSTLTITEGGSYVLSGSLTGSVVVTAPTTKAVQLILNGVSITADKNAAIYCSQADILTITLAEGTINTVTDADGYTYSDTIEEEPDAAIFSKVDLTINGTGSLAVDANFNNGIGTKDDLIITSGIFNISAPNHGLRGRDSVTISDGDFTIVSGADGIQSNNDEDINKGWISLEGGSYNIQSGNDAIQAETSLAISNGSYSLIAGGGNTVTPADTTGSYKGIKASTDITLTGGTFVIDSADDSVHANGNISITGGNFTLSSGDDGVHADGDLTIDGDTTVIDVKTSYEGLEAMTMTLANGVIDVYATDDGINVAGGMDSGTEGRFSPDSFNNGSRWLKITGGTITVVSGRDGIDVNGSGEMTGGDLNITAGTLGEGDTIDTDGTFARNGGTIVESGGNAGGGMGGGRGGQPPRQ